MTNIFKSAIIIALSWALTSCGFAYEKELIENYFLVAPDAGEQMALDYNNKDEPGKNYTTIVLATVFEAQWNNRFIVVKTHPKNIRESIKIFYRNLHIKRAIVATPNTKGYFTEQEWEELDKVDSLAEKDVDEVLKSNDFLNAKSAKSQTTLYYLLDTKNQNRDPLFFLTEKELISALQKHLVGSLNHRQYFEDLDK